MVVESLLLLAGKTIVAAVATDAWPLCKRGFARLFGRGDPDKEQSAERKLEDTRQQLSGTDAEQARAEQAVAWKTRLEVLLDENPGAETELRGLVEQIRAQLPAGVSAADHSVAAGGDVNISATSGGVAGGVIQGGVTAGNPPVSGPGNRQPDPN